MTEQDTIKAISGEDPLLRATLREVARRMERKYPLDESGEVVEYEPEMPARKVGGRGGAW